MQKIKHNKIRGFTPTPKDLIIKHFVKKDGVFKQKNYQSGNTLVRGFTLIELMVVLAIMGIMASLVIFNYNTERSVRNIKIAQNELVTNIKKMQSYALSSRTLPSGHVVQYYAVKIDTTSSFTQYTMQALYDVNSTSTNPTVVDMETINLPPGIQFQAASGANYPFVIQRATVPAQAHPSCVILAFQLPFAKTFVNEGCSFNNFQTSPPDDYRKLIEYVQNTDLYPTTTDSILTIYLQDQRNVTANRTVQVRGVTGIINAN